jgi:hypothetical protein
MGMAWRKRAFESAYLRVEIVLLLRYYLGSATRDQNLDAQDARIGKEGEVDHVDHVNHTNHIVCINESLSPTVL